MGFVPFGFFLSVLPEAELSEESVEGFFTGSELVPVAEPVEGLSGSTGTVSFSSLGSAGSVGSVISPWPGSSGSSESSRQPGNVFEGYSVSTVLVGKDFHDQVSADSFL